MRYVRVRAVEGREEVEGLRGGLAIQELESFFLFWNRRNLPWIARAAFSVSGAVRSMSISSSSSAFLMLPGFPFSSGSDAWLAAGGVLVLSSLIPAAGRGVAGAGEARGPRRCVREPRPRVAGLRGRGPGGLGGESARCELLLNAAPNAPAAALLREPLQIGRAHV